MKLVHKESVLGTKILIYRTGNLIVRRYYAQYIVAGEVYEGWGFTASGARGNASGKYYDSLWAKYGTEKFTHPGLR